MNINTKQQATLIMTAAIAMAAIAMAAPAAEAAGYVPKCEPAGDVGVYCTASVAPVKSADPCAPDNMHGSHCI